MDERLEKWKWFCAINFMQFYTRDNFEELDSPAVSALGVRSRKLSNIGQSSDGWSKIYYFERVRA
jgi:hypothetical protein